MLSLPLPTGRRMWAQAFGPPDWAKPSYPLAYFNCEMDSNSFLVTCRQWGFFHRAARLEILPEVWAKTANEEQCDHKLPSFPLLPPGPFILLRFSNILYICDCFFMLSQWHLTEETKAAPKSSFSDLWNCIKTRMPCFIIASSSLSLSLPSVHSLHLSVYAMSFHSYLKHVI